MLMFALTLPMTRLAGGPAEAPQLPPDFVAIGRAAGAGLLSIAFLLATRAPWPRASQWPLLGLSALGVVFGFPWFTGWAVRHVPAVHAAVITGFLPLATALVGALWLRQRPSRGFWACAGLGFGLVLAFALIQGSGHLQAADALLLAAVGSAAVGYVGGTRLATPSRAGAPALTPAQVICWMLVLSLPVTLPWTLWLAQRHSAALAGASAAAWGGFAYVTLVSMWLGFFAWYRGLALGGAVRVSQVQLVQPFVSMLAAVPLLGERLDALTLGFGLAVIASVLFGKRMPVAGPPSFPLDSPGGSR
jgi:drug/metabolite transporter (DMT)-like permease